jgi:iron complex outermembrane receptor protein
LLKLHGLNNKLYTELTFFSTQITNLLVARTAEDHIGINAGVSSHIGMEFSELSTVTNESIPTIKLFFGCGQSLHLKTLLMETIILEINSLAVPNAQWNVGLDASSTSGFSLTTSFLVK